mgnify:FL=1
MSKKPHPGDCMLSISKKWVGLDCHPVSTKPEPQIPWTMANNCPSACDPPNSQTLREIPGRSPGQKHFCLLYSNKIWGNISILN